MSSLLIYVLVYLLSAIWSYLLVLFVLHTAKAKKSKEIDNSVTKINKIIYMNTIDPETHRISAQQIMYYVCLIPIVNTWLVLRWLSKLPGKLFKRKLKS